MKKPFVLAVCGLKNSGKTTLICNLLPLLKAQGLSIAVIKHDGHDFTPDLPGTDSHKLRTAGAEAVAVYSASQLMLVYTKPTDLDTLVHQFSSYDLVIIEGGKSSIYPKIAVSRAALTETLHVDPQTVLAYASNAVSPNPTAPNFALDDYPGLAALIGRVMAKA